MQPDQNHLLAQLPARERKQLLTLMEPVQLTASEVLYHAGEKTRHVYFPVDSYISLLSSVDGHPGVEVGMVGSEGMCGVQLALGVPSTSLQALVQGPGAALRMEKNHFVEALEHSEALRLLLQRYTHVLMAQLATSAACLRYHQVTPRLARWLLMTQDRAHDSSFQMTHQFLALMLGVRRVGITTAAGQLQREGLINYRRGALTVLDRQGLEAVSCSCYASDRLSYSGVFG